MLSQSNRLKKTRDFNLLFRYGQWLNGRLLDVKVLELERKRQYWPRREDAEKFQKQLKIGFSVGLKISKKAVERNRLRRQLSEAVRVILQAGRIKTGYYLLIVAKKDALGVSLSKISQEMELLLSRDGLLK